jgi:uncharacterized protein
MAMVEFSEIQKCIDLVVAGYKPEKVILFGSYAYGTPNYDSDVDICIVKKDNRTARTKTLEISKLLINRRFPIDLLVVNPEEFQASEVQRPVLIDILKYGKLVYEQ